MTTLSFCIGLGLEGLGIVGRAWCLGLWLIDFELDGLVHLPFLVGSFSRNSFPKVGFRLLG